VFCFLQYLKEGVLVRNKLLVYILIIALNLALLPKQAVAQSCTPQPPDDFCSVSSDVTVTATVPDSTATFSGFAAANSTVTIKDNGVTAATTVANASGIFNRTIVSSPGLHDFALFLTDTSGRTTPETLFENVNLPFHVDTAISNIHLPPTIELSRTNITNGESTLVFGQGAPGSTLHLMLNGNEIYSTVIGGGSDWQFTLSSGYIIGTNSLYAYLTKTGINDSINSFTLNLEVGNCKRSDLNCDGFVNLTDFSILMYYWESAYDLADTNNDGIVGLIDFSIMMFDWTE